jgi:transposase InsO family protein
VAKSTRTELAPDALEQAIWTRCPPKGVIHHSDHGSQYLSIRYSERSTESGVDPSTGPVGDSYDNALAETIIGRYKTEVVYLRRPWRILEAVEYASLGWVDWLNNRRLLEAIGNVPPAEFEMHCLQQQAEPAIPASR